MNRMEQCLCTVVLFMMFFVFIEQCTRTTNVSVSQSTQVAYLFYHFTFPLFPCKPHAFGGKLWHRNPDKIQLTSAMQLGLHMSSAAVSGSPFFTFDQKKTIHFP